MNKLSLAMDLSTQSLSQYLNYDFNSFCIFDGVPLAAGDGGIFELDSHQSDNGTPIDAWFESLGTDLGLGNFKRIRKFHVGYQSAGDLVVGMSADKSRLLRFPLSATDPAAFGQNGNWLSGSRDGYGRYWSFNVRNVGGCDFSVDEIAVAITILNRYK